MDLNLCNEFISKIKIYTRKFWMHQIMTKKMQYMYFLIFNMHDQLISELTSIDKNVRRTYHSIQMGSTKLF